MKGKRKHKADGGINGSTGGENLAEKDEKENPKDRSANDEIGKEAEERKSGGRAKKATGGRAARKHGGKMVEMKGEKAKMHAGRMPRKSGGRTGSDSSPFSSARKGTAPPGRKIEMESDG